MGGAPSHLPLQASLARERARVSDRNEPNLCQSRRERGQRQRAHELDLVLELDSVFFVRPASRFGHQCKRVSGPSCVGVLDEIRVPRRDLRAADPVALQPAGLEHQPGRQLVVRVLEDAPKRPLVRRLCCLSQRLELGDRCLRPIGPRRLWHA